jgi:hypothetical protein
MVGVVRHWLAPLARHAATRHFAEQYLAEARFGRKAAPHCWHGKSVYFE